MGSVVRCWLATEKKVLTEKEKRVLYGNGLGPSDSASDVRRTIPQTLHQWLWTGKGLFVRWVGEGGS